jgi:protein-S-isoprenylcysteine O-methyltransferase Ste14
MPATRILALLLLLVVVISESRWEGISFTSSIFFLAGCVLVGIASFGRLWCSLYIAGHKDATLVCLGPYSMSRNPLYLFSLIGGAGVGLTTETLLIPCCIVVLFLIYYPSVIRGEEKRLRALFGESHEKYCTKTPLFFPKPSLLSEPESYLVNPKVFRRNIFGALWFVWLVGVLELIEAFHEAGILPAYLHIF